MKRRRIEIPEALERAGECSHILAYRYDGVLLERSERQDVNAVVLDPSCFEARVFSDSMEILFLSAEGEKQAFLLADDKKDAGVHIDREYELAYKYRGLGSRIIEREYLEPDEDGQMNVVAKRLVAAGKGE